jgi:hypothetical protein
LPAGIFDRHVSVLHSLLRRHLRRDYCNHLIAWQPLLGIRVLPISGHPLFGGREF